jgi:hypothetical protein
MKLIKFQIVMPLALLLMCFASCKKNVEGGNAEAGNLPKTIQEHWLGHDDLLTRTYYNDEIAVYIAPDMDSTVKWFYPLMTKVWPYVKKTYGPFGTESRLNVDLHGTKYLINPDGTTGLALGLLKPYLDADAGYRNLIDISSSEWNNQEVMTPVMIHETGHIVEGASDQVSGSPSYNVWGDSKWMDIYIYDVYKGLGMNDKAAAWYNDEQFNVVDFPRANTYWFRDWWYPIYSKHGESAVLVKYFKLLAENFPKVKTAKAYQFTRDMNMGELIHFWSGAAGVNLKAQATIAFGWSQEREQQFKNAQEDFPGVKYNY